MPDNLDEPSHALMRTVAAELPSPGGSRTPPGTRAPSCAGLVFPPALAAGPAPMSGALPISTRWPGLDAVIEWLRGTGLRPFLAPLDADGQQAFLDRYRTLLDGYSWPCPAAVCCFPFPASSSSPNSERPPFVRPERAPGVVRPFASGGMPLRRQPRPFAPRRGNLMKIWRMQF